LRLFEVKPADCLVALPLHLHAKFQLNAGTEAKYYYIVIRRFYVHNYRCLENFELPIADRSSVLLIGKNGAGKSTVGLALEILQKIARGAHRVDEVVKPKDLARGRSDVPMRFEIEVKLDDITYEYFIAFDFPPGFKELRVIEEGLGADGKPV
jgi:ABC-type microcin C transport system duplicated ATPase subunit YejF